MDVVALGVRLNAIGNRQSISNLMMVAKAIGNCYFRFDIEIDYKLHMGCVPTRHDPTTAHIEI